MKIETWKIVMSLLIISCFSYGEGAVQYITRMIFLPLSFLLSLHFERYKLVPKTAIGIFPVFVFCALTSLIIYNYLINQTSTKAVWKFLEILLLFGTLWNVGQRFNRVNIHVYSLLDYTLFNISLICICSIFLEFIFGNQNLTELSGYFPIINANGVGTIFGVQVLYFMLRKKVILASTMLIMTILSGSMSAVIAIFLAIAWFFIIKVLPNLRGITPNWKMGASGLVGTFVLYWSIGWVSDDIKRLSGRTDIWENLFAALNDTMGVFNGVGYGYVRTIVGIETGVSKTLHNSYLEIMFSVGYIGFVLFIMLNIILIMKLNKVRCSSSVCDPVIMILIFLLIKSLTTSNLVYLSVESLLYSIIILLIPRMVRRQSGRSLWIKR